MLRLLAVCLASAVLCLSAACSATNVSSDFTPDREGASSLGGDPIGDDAMKAKGPSSSLGGDPIGDDAMKAKTASSSLGGDPIGDDAMNTPPPPPPAPVRP